MNLVWIQVANLELMSITRYVYYVPESSRYLVRSERLVLFHVHWLMGHIVNRAVKI